MPKFDNTPGSLLPTYTVALLPTAVGITGQAVYVSNGQAGAPCVGVSDGTIWRCNGILCAIA